MKATYYCPLPAMNGHLFMLFKRFCRTTSLQMVTRDVWLQDFSAGLFFLTDGVKELQALAYFIAGVRAGVSATRSAAVGKACFTLAVEGGIDEANVRAHHPTFCTVLPRRQDMISSHIEPSPCGRNVASKRSRGRRARHLHSFVEVSRGEEMRAFRHLTSRCLLTPYSVSPWVLSDAPAIYWMIGTAEMWTTFAAPSFGTFFARRVRDGFRLPHCMGCCKAILYATRLCGGCHAVEIFDVVEKPLEGGGGGPPARVIVDGFTRPFEFAIPYLYFHELTADIAEYIQVAAVLHTFNVLSSAPSTAAADRPVSLKDSGGGSFNLFRGWSQFLHFCQLDMPTPSLCVPFPQWEERVMTDLERQWHFSLHR
ncbi:hypothetical protein TcCL_Unassigned02540 [Trypanosoma cruzi]|nr:hypothetical protein TcCL_Unassigned02540 [Trypanosoma cruzi]